MRTGPVTEQLAYIRSKPLMRFRTRLPLLLGVSLLLYVVSTSPQEGSSVGEWPTFGGDAGSTKFSALSQIDSGNDSRLTPV
jgi:hypothetical protein